jgi:hypothetical protein
VLLERYSAEEMGRPLMERFGAARENVFSMYFVRVSKF